MLLKMNRHKLIAIFMAPILIVGGFIAADYYESSKQAQMRTLVPVGECQPLLNHCELEAADLRVRVQVNQSVLTHDGFVPLTVQASAPLDDLLLALTDKKTDAKPMRLKQSFDAMHWEGEYFIANETNLKKLLLRMVLSYKNTMYFSEVAVKVDGN